MLVSRKLAMMAAFLFFSDSPEQAWFLGSAVVIIALVVHSAASPYEDMRVDWCEFLSLVSTLFICQAGVVFKVINDPRNPDSSERAKFLVGALENVSMFLIGLNCIGAVYVEVRMMKILRAAQQEGADYKENLVELQLEEARETVARLEAALEKAQDHKEEFKARAEARAMLRKGGNAALAIGRPGQSDAPAAESPKKKAPATFDNPMHQFVDGGGGGADGGDSDSDTDDDGDDQDGAD